MSLIEFEKKNQIAIFTINRPEVMNCFSPALLMEMEEDMKEFMLDDDLRVGIITGKGEKAFCAGADIKEMLPFSKSCADARWKFPRTPMKGLYVDKPLIAAVNGYAFGGGGELALACDIRIASENASFKWPEASLGILPGLGGTQRLPRIVGQAKAAEILFLNEKINADEALNLGLVSKVVPLAQLMEEAIRMAEQISKLAPLSVKAIKKCLYYGMEMELDKALQLEDDLKYSLYASEDYAEGRQAFIEKRPANFKGK